MFTNIVVPLDGSPSSEHALPWARAIATRSGGALRLVHVHVPLRIPTSQEVLGPRVGETLRRMGAETQGREASYLREVGERLWADTTTTPPTVTTAILRGATVASLAREARDTGATLLVMATHARRPTDRLWLSGIADALARRCPVPVLIVRGSDQPPADAEPTVEHILVPVDGSQREERVLAHVRELARLFGAHVTLLRVLRPDRPVAVEQGAAAYLESLAAPLRDEGVRVETRVLHHTDVPAAIASAAAETAAGMIVLSSRCRGGIPRLVLGNTAEAVLRATPRPILVVGTRTG